MTINKNKFEKTLLLPRKGCIVPLLLSGKPRALSAAINHVNILSISAATHEFGSLYSVNVAFCM